MASALGGAAGSTAWVSTRLALADARGAVTTEYAVVVGVSGILIAIALAAVAPPLIASYQATRHTLMAPVP